MASEHLIKITNKAKQLRRANPRLKWTDAVKKASKLIKPATKKAATKKRVAKKVSGVKKSAPKKAATKTHKDTKNHNVNIRVVSGVGPDPLKVYAEHLRRIKYFNVQIIKCKLLLKSVTDSFAKAQITNDLKVYKKQLLITKKMAAMQKKLI